jgi:hypothetical protein
VPCPHKRHPEWSDEDWVKALEVRGDIRAIRLRCKARERAGERVSRFYWPWSREGDNWSFDVQASRFYYPEQFAHMTEATVRGLYPEVVQPGDVLVPLPVRVDPNGLIIPPPGSSEVLRSRVWLNCSAILRWMLKGERWQYTVSIAFMSCKKSIVCVIA